MKQGDRDGLLNVLLSSITVAYMLVCFCGETIPWKECSKLIESFSLVRLHSSGVTPETIVGLLRMHVKESYFAL